MTVSAKTLSSLLELLYEAAAVPQEWTTFLSAIAGSARTSTAVTAITEAYANILSTFAPAE